MAFTTYDPSTHTLAQLVSAIFTGSGGVALQPGTVSVGTGPTLEEASSISFYDGSLTALGIGAGLLLTSGDPTPATTNEIDGASDIVDSGVESDADLEATVNEVFEDRGVFDITYLEFQINVTDPLAVGLRFDLLFGSEEYPDYIDDYVDVAGVYVNGQNYALFNGSDEHPLSVIQDNVNAGYFIDNDPWVDEAAAGLPIEYDGVSVKLAITAPIHQGLNTIKIAIADTGDSALDSGVFISGMQAVNYAGYGLSQQVNLQGGITNDTPSNQTYLGTSANNIMHFGSTGGGHDVYDGGGGLDSAQFDIGLGQGQWVWNGSVGVLSVTSGQNSTTLFDVERVLLGDGLYVGLDTAIGDTTAGVYAMLRAAFQTAPSISLLSQWVAEADGLGGDLGAVGDLMIDLYGGSFTDADVISYLYFSIIGSAPSQDIVDQLVGLIGGTTTIGDLFAEGAAITLFGESMAGVVGSPQVLDYSYFD